MAAPTLDEAAIFNAARKLGSPEARSAYLRQACGDATALHARLQALLAVHDREESFLAAPAVLLQTDGDSDTPPVAEGPAPPALVGSFGDYELLGEIGRGGMGWCTGPGRRAWAGWWR